jgi:hypothetical protein
MATEIAPLSKSPYNLACKTKDLIGFSKPIRSKPKGQPDYPYDYPIDPISHA